MNEDLKITLSAAAVVFLCMIASFLIGHFIISTAEAAQTKQATNTLDAYAPFEEPLQITPSDSTTYNPPLRGCVIETDGDIAFKGTKGASSVILTVKATQLIPFMIEKVLATGTTSTMVCGR